MLIPTFPSSSKIQLPFESYVYPCIIGCQSVVLTFLKKQLPGNTKAFLPCLEVIKAERKEFTESIKLAFVFYNEHAEIT